MFTRKSLAPVVMAWLALVLAGCQASDRTARSAADASASTMRPNIVLIVVDDLGNNDIAPNNPGTLYRTPNLDSLATRSTRFADSYAAAPVCSPARYALLTGRYPARAGATDWFRTTRQIPKAGRFGPAVNRDYMPLEDVTVAEALKSSGYATAFVGKWHLGEDERYWPENQGFDINIGGWGSGSPTGVKGFFAPYRNPRLTDGPPGEYLTRRLAQEADRIITDFSARKQPFFLNYSLYAVHTPLTAPEDRVAAVQARIDASGKSTRFGTDRQVWPTKEERRVRLTQTNATYGAMVEEMDAAVGVVMASLARNGVADNTIVIFTSDNGGLSTAEGHSTSNLPLRGGKGWSFEGGLRVPLIVHMPGQKAPRVVHDLPVSGIDIAPTIVDLAAASALGNADGVSLRGLLLGDRTAAGMFAQRPLFWHYPHYSNQGGYPASVVRVGPLKLIQDLEDGSVALFDVTVDIAERYDLSLTEPEKLARLRTILATWQRDAGVSFLRPKDGSTPWSP